MTNLSPICVISCTYAWELLSLYSYPAVQYLPGSPRVKARTGRLWC